MVFRSDRPLTFDSVARMAVWAALAYGGIRLLAYLSDVLIPFAVAFLLAYLIHPLVLAVERKLKSRSLSILVSLLLLAGALTALVLLVVPVIMNEMSRMGHIVAGIAGDSEIAARAAKYLPGNFWQAVRDALAREDVQAFFRTEHFVTILEGAARKLLPGLWGVITGTASFFMGLVGLAVIGLYLVFLLLDYEKVSEGWRNLLPAKYRPGILSLVREFQLSMNSYFRGQALVAAIVGVLTATGFVLIGLPLGLLLGLFIGLLNMVPYLQIVGLVPALFLALFHSLETGTSLWISLGSTALVVAVVQVIQDAFLVPRILGKATGLNPVMILLSLSVWGKLLGLLGLIIAIPMTCFLLAFFHRVFRRETPAAAGGAEA
jgi:predicted PurR-regulated permease PerM